MLGALRGLGLVAVLLLGGCVSQGGGDAGPATVRAEVTDAGAVVPGVEVQPLMAQASRLREVLQYLGSGLRPDDAEALAEMARHPSPDSAEAVQRLLDAYCLAFVHINPEARVKVARGPAPAELTQGGWRNFLVKVHNESGTRAPLAWESPNAAPVLHASSGQPHPRPENAISPGELEHRFLEMAFYDRAPLGAALSGMKVEYRVLQIYTSQTGQREAQIGFHVGQGTQDLGYRSAIPVLFACAPSVKLTLKVRDHDGGPAMASFIFRDNIDRGLKTADGKTDYRLAKAEKEPWQRPGLSAKPLVGVYPLPSRRVADSDEYPDFFFQPQVYRADGEHVYLPPGSYDVTWTRGPEYLPQTRTIRVPEGVREHSESFPLKRWTHLAALGWYSGDHHVHAGGCSHYESPEAGVKPEAMFRQAQGEDLNVSCVLTWGPCWYHQKTFFEGDVHRLSDATNVLRYDVEVSGFPSSHAGHLCLLRLKEDDYPGTTLIEEWPSWTLPVLQWGKEQGGVVGYSHSGWGLEPMTPAPEFPNYAMPRFDGIGANEYIVTAVHGAVDFISAGDTPLPWELNIWYHVLNCGFRTAISGETDYPCIFDDRVGMARSYARLDGPLNFDAFVEEIRSGKVYVSDGLSHIVDVKASAGRGTAGLGGELKLASPAEVTVTARAAAYLPKVQDAAGAKIAASGPTGRPYWHLEKSRIAASRKVSVELIVNGYPVAWQDITADGSWQDVSFTAPIERSSWMALRILYSAHTNPVYAIVDGKPIRASKRSAAWCRDSVDQCWNMKMPAIREADGERAEAQAAYEHARAVYAQILEEAHDDLLPGAGAQAQAGRPPLPLNAIVIGIGSPSTMQTPGWNFVPSDPTSYQGRLTWTRAGDGQLRHRWNFDGVPPGRYAVHAWIPDDPNKDHAKDAVYRVRHARGSDEVKVDQSADTQTWRRLGEYTLDADGYVELSNRSSGNVVADAVMLEPMGK